MAARWTFDADVARHFDDIARQNIPNYTTVIARCVELAKDVFANRPEARILEVGSARGRMLSCLIDAGFKNVFGVESSPHMIDVSAHKERVTQSSTFPSALGAFDLVLANWTLHFVPERAAYIDAIFKGLNSGGWFVLSERMRGSPESYRHYHDFKRKQGMTEQEIIDKEASLQGVLEPRPLGWYLETLAKTGFVDVEVIDAAWCFNTLLCRKPS